MLNVNNAKTESVRKRILIAVYLLLTLVVSYLIFSYAFNRNESQVATKARCDESSDNRRTNIKLNGTELPAEVTESDEQRVVGLSGRECLEEDSAMLFIFDQPGIHCIWMKDMKFSLDILWLNDQKEVVKILEEIDPGTYPKQFCPEDKVSYVIEMNEGAVQSYGIELGQQFDL